MRVKKHLPRRRSIEVSLQPLDSRTYRLTPLFQIVMSCPGHLEKPQMHSQILVRQRPRLFPLTGLQTSLPVEEAHLIVQQSSSLKLSIQFLLRL